MIVRVFHWDEDSLRDNEDLALLELDARANRRTLLILRSKRGN